MARILLIDDEEYIRQYYSLELSKAGHQVFGVASGLEALEWVDHVRPEVVILDIRMPDCDGLELLTDIRCHFPDLPIILCTAYDTYRYEPAALAADAYVVKSFDLSRLKREVGRALEADACLRPGEEVNTKQNHRRL